jgi:hypothetical protein
VLSGVQAGPEAQPMSANIINKRKPNTIAFDVMLLLSFRLLQV